MGLANLRDESICEAEQPKRKKEHPISDARGRGRSGNKEGNKEHPQKGEAKQGRLGCDERHERGQRPSEEVSSCNSKKHGVSHSLYIHQEVDWTHR